MTRRIRVLDGWRGVSILVVVAAHLIIARFSWLVRDGSFRDVTRPGGLVLAFKAAIWRLSEVGGLFGVSMFFVISGFIITTLLLDEERSQGQVSLLRFYIRRAWRILPALGVYIAVVALMAWRGMLDVGPASFAAAATFTCNITGGCGWYLGHLWTLAVEEQFYLVWPALFVLLGPQRVRVARGIAIAALGLSASGVADASGPNGVAAACIAIGVVLALDVELRHCLESVTSPVRAMVAVLICAAHGFVPDGSVAAHMVLFAFPLAVTMVFGEALKPASTLHHAVSNPALASIGLLSYSVYLWQQLFTGAGQTVVLLPIAALASFYLVERPFVRLGRGTFPLWRRHSPAT